MRQVLIPRHIQPLPVMPWLRTAGIGRLGGETMGTTWSVRFVAPPGTGEDAIRSGIEATLARVIAQMSTWVADSDISRFNNAAAGSRHLLPAEFFTVLRCALSLAEATGGAYDPTAGALVDVWGFGPAGPRHDVPPPAAIATALGSTGWRRLSIASSTRMVRQSGGLRLDLSSIAKGFAVDLVAETLLQAGIRDFLVEIGGELRGEGTKPDGSPWWVALEAPAGSGVSETIIALHGLAVATSGDAQRAFVSGGRRHSHTLDPRTGYPVPEQVASVSVIHPSAMQADALATALTVMGPEAGQTFAEARDLAARFLLRTPDGFEQRMTPAFAAMLDD